jgi:hypothetical protein
VLNHLGTPKFTLQVPQTIRPILIILKPEWYSIVAESILSSLILKTLYKYVFSHRQCPCFQGQSKICRLQNPSPADHSLLHLPTALVNPAAERLGKAVDVIDAPSANNSVSHLLHLSAKIPLSALLYANLFSRMHSGAQTPSLLFRNPRSYEIHFKARV